MIILSIILSYDSLSGGNYCYCYCFSCKCGLRSDPVTRLIDGCYCQTPSPVQNWKLTLLAGCGGYANWLRRLSKLVTEAMWLHWSVNVQLYTQGPADQLTTTTGRVCGWVVGPACKNVV